MNGPPAVVLLLLALYYERGKINRYDREQVVKLTGSLCEKCHIGEKDKKARALKWAAEHDLITIIKSGRGIIPQIKLNDAKYYE